ncbi:ROK family transcriptional regulator [Microbacterium sp.]|uniref:ROK family transcriptional regulator n=1 Tax=Microbacterium sp. TaxID=51671 RepID=UPI003F9BC834
MDLRRRGTNLPKMGDFNQSVILEAIRRSREGLSRTELVEATGLSAQTITNITRRLLSEGLIEEAGRMIQGPGKPRTTLRLNAASRLSIGVHLDPAMMTFVLLDLTGAVLERSTTRMPADDARRIIAAMAESVEDLIERSQLDRAAITGIGVATPGPLDAARGTVIDPPKLHSWHRVPLRDALQEATGLSVTLEKDTTSAAVAELWTGDHPPDGSFLFVYLGIGIGTALVLDGAVVRGASHNAGEVGHIIVDPEGPECTCGQRGCVEVVCTPQAIVERAEHAGVLADDRVGSDAESVDARFTELCDRAAGGDRDASAVLETAVHHLAVLISALTNMLDIDRVVLGGPFWSRLSAISLSRLPTLLDRSSATRAVRDLPVRGTVIGDDVAAVGAGCVVLDEVLTPRAAALFLDS